MMVYLRVIFFTSLWVSLGLGIALPSHAKETPGTTPIALVEEAYLAHRRGNYDHAIKLYTKIIQRRGLTKRERAISYLLRGEAKRDDGKLSESILDFTRALRQWANYPHAYFFRGRVYEDQGDFIKAYADVSKAVALDPQRESYLSHLAVLKKRMSAADLKKVTEGEKVNPAPLELPEDGLPVGAFPEGEVSEEGLPTGELSEEGLPAGELSEEGLPTGELSKGELPKGELPKGELPKGELAKGGEPKGGLPKD